MCHTNRRNPFDEEFFQKAIFLSIVEKEKLIELSCDTVLKNEFKWKQHIHFWIDIRNKYDGFWEGN